MRKKIIAGNWKMNKSWDEGINLVSELKNKFDQELQTKVEMWLATPYIHLHSVSDLISGIPSLSIAAQNVHHHTGGAYTGEISASMIASTGARAVIIGHSERRLYYSETDELIRQKCMMALDAGLKIILCVGELLEDRESGNQETVVKRQLEKVLAEIPKEKRMNFILAYEPVWAIGTGKTASPDQAEAMHNFIRNYLFEIWPDEADNIVLLYGGSCNPGNAQGLFTCENIDGGLIGGASLNSSDFIELAKILAKS